MWFILPFLSESWKMFFWGLLFCTVIFLISRFKKYPIISMYGILVVSSMYMFMKTYMDREFFSWLFIFIFFSTSILFQRVSAIMLSLFFSLATTTYYWITLDPEVKNAVMTDHDPFPHFIVTFAVSAFLFINQVRLNRKLQTKSATETINAKKGRKKTKIILDKLTESAKSVSLFSSKLNGNISNLKNYSEVSTNSFKEMNHSFVLQNENLKNIDNNIITINSTIQTVTDSTLHMVEQLDTTSRSTLEGYNQLTNLTKGMDEVDSTINSLGLMMQNLQRQSKNILGILAFISEVSQRTKVLAFNASLEASRQGIAGQGFSIIAQEVKKLSDSTEQSAKEISDILITLSEQTDFAVRQTKESEEKVETSKTVLENMSHVFFKILSDSDDTRKHFNKVSGMVNELSSSSTQIVEQIIELTNINEENTAEINQLFTIIDKQNDQIKEISNEFINLEESLNHLANENKGGGE
jgi:methyl-accepting chemotaxis protein